MEYYDEIMGYTQRLTGDKTIAQDVTQETYDKVLEANQKSHTVIQKAFLYKVALHLVIGSCLKRETVCSNFV